MGEGNKQLTALELFRGSKECPHLALSALLATVNLGGKAACLLARLPRARRDPTHLSTPSVDQGYMQLYLELYL
jgi:hypothetical protein